MGCSSPQNASIPNLPAHYANRLNAIFQISHPLNVNKKYEHFITIEQNQTTGFGFKKTNAYHCLTTVDDLQAKIKEFWETRTSGQPHIWEAIKKAIHNPNDKQAQNLLTENRIYLLHGSIQLCVDSKFNKYQIPVFCINTPLTARAMKVEDRNLVLEFEDNDCEIVIRSAKFPNGDIRYNDKTSMKIMEIKEKIIKEKGLPAQTVIRFFYQGREMKDENYLGSYGYTSGMVIQAMIR